MVSSPLGSPSSNVAISYSRQASSARRNIQDVSSSAHNTSTAANASVLAYLGACSVYVAAGPVLILLNNTIIHEHKFPYPIALSALGVAFSAAVSRALFGLGLVSFKQPQLAQSRKFTLCRAVPIGALSAATLALGNAAYVYLSVAVCQMLKAVTPAITLGMLFLLRIESPSLAEVSCVVLITLGTLVSTRGDIALSQLGIALQLGANFAEAARVVLSQQLLASMKLPLLEMQYHVAPPQLFCLLVASAIFELRDAASRESAYASLAAHPGPFAFAGVLGLALQVAGLLAVKIAGSVAVKLLGIARGAGLVLFEAIKAAEGAPRPSAMQLSGYATSVGAFLLYTWIRLRQPLPLEPPKKVKSR